MSAAEPLKVLVVHNAYGKRSGEEVVVDQQCALLASRGHEVRRYERSSAGLAENGRDKARAFFAALGSKAVQREFAGLLSDFRPDVVHVHNLYPWISPAILPLCREATVPVVMTVHNYRLICPNGLLFSHGQICERCVESGEHWCVLKNCEGGLAKSAGYALRNYVARRRRWYLDGVARFAVLTDFQRRKLLAAGYPAQRIALLPNMAEDACPHGDGPLGNQLGYVGRVSREKGVQVLLEAMRGLAGMACSIAGSFARQSELPGQAPGNVRFLGQLDRAQLDDLYPQLRFIVSPSICYEGFPMSVVEAMARGKAVIASRIGGIPEIVEDGVTGLLFEPGNAAELAEKLRYLWERPELCRQMGEAGRDKVAREYSADRYYERLMTIYQDAMARHT